MKLKLFLISLFALLSLVAYQKYTEYSALKSIDSYESCLAAKGSLLQESYPATCVTRLGSRFTEPTTKSTNNDNNISIKLNSGYTLEFSRPNEAIFDDHLLFFPKLDTAKEIYFINFQPSSTSLDISTNKDKEKVIVGGKPAVRSVSCGYTGPAYTCQTFVDITVSPESYLRIATIFYDNKEFMTQFDQILSTFHFLD